MSQDIKKQGKISSSTEDLRQIQATRGTEIHQLITSAIIAALYVVLTLPFAQISFGIIQIRFSELLCVLPVVTPGAIWGLFLGCFLANLLNPFNLGPIDIVLGSLATLSAAWLTYHLSRRFYRGSYDESALTFMKDSWNSKQKAWRRLLLDIAILSPSCIFNALIVGTYLPFLITDAKRSLGAVLVSQLSILASQTLVVIVLGLPFLRLLSRLHVPKLLPQAKDLS